jgi:hypothetical protein
MSARSVSHNPEGQEPGSVYDRDRQVKPYHVASESQTWNPAKGDCHSHNAGYHGAMAEYRIVKWSPAEPEKRHPATEEIFTDLGLAQIVKTEWETALPHRCFAVEAIEGKP